MPHPADGTGRQESALAMMRRHVVEGAGRIRGQQALIAHLHASGHPQMMPMAEELLHAMMEFQVLAEAHLPQEEAKPGWAR